MLLKNLEIRPHRSVVGVKTSCNHLLFEVRIKENICTYKENISQKIAVDFNAKKNQPKLMNQVLTKYDNLKPAGGGPNFSVMFVLLFQKSFKY